MVSAVRALSTHFPMVGAMQACTRFEQATASSRAAFWDIAGAPIDGSKVIAFEGGFAMTECHERELKTQALALQGTVGAAQQVGILGAVIGTFGFHALRMKLAAAFGRDTPAAFIEDALAIGGVFIIIVALR
jgi:hypothetical protein